MFSKMDLLECDEDHARLLFCVNQATRLGFECRVVVPDHWLCFSKYAGADLIMQLAAGAGGFRRARANFGTLSVDVGVARGLTYLGHGAMRELLNKKGEIEGWNLGALGLSCKDGLFITLEANDISRYPLVRGVSDLRRELFRFFQSHTPALGTLMGSATSLIMNYLEGGRGK